MSEQNTAPETNRAMNIMELAASLSERDQERIYAFILGGIELGRLNQGNPQKSA